MGVSRLMQLIKEKCPDAIKEKSINSYKGKTVAIDAYLTIYQYIIGTQTKKGETIMEMKDNEGNLTAHLLGILNRSIFLMERGILPCWVFDGNPPTEKWSTLSERQKKKEESNERKEVALSNGDLDQALKYANRSISISNLMIEDAISLIKFLGLPCIQVKNIFKIF
jgi:flap endonuclease-1